MTPAVAIAVAEAPAIHLAQDLLGTKASQVQRDLIKLAIDRRKRYLGPCSSPPLLDRPTNSVRVFFANPAGDQDVCFAVRRSAAREILANGRFGAKPALGEAPL